MTSGITVEVNGLRGVQRFLGPRRQLGPVPGFGCLPGQRRHIQPAAGQRRGTGMIAMLYQPAAFGGAGHRECLPQCLALTIRPFIEARRPVHVYAVEKVGRIEGHRGLMVAGDRA